MSINEDGIRYGYCKLASAIVKQAVMDYKDAKNNQYGRETKKEVSEFIKSPFFNLLTKIDPDYLLSTLGHKPVSTVRAKELAMMYGVSIRTIYRRIQEGKIVL